MEKERKIKVLSLVSMIVAVLGLTVAFAALSQTLTINGTASVDAAEWDVGFESDFEYFQEGSATINKTPTVSRDSVSDISVTLTKPNDMVIYEGVISNKGTINAEIASIEKSELCTLQSPVESCDWDNDGVVTQSDVDKVNDNITFIVIKPGYEISSGNLVDGGELNVGDKIYGMTEENIRNNKSVARKFTIIIFYGKYIAKDNEDETIIESTELPKRNLTFNDFKRKNKLCSSRLNEINVDKALIK